MAKARVDYALHWITYWNQHAPSWYKAQCRGYQPRHKEHPKGEHRFAPPRRWRFDWALIEAKVAVEIDGGNRMTRYSPKQKRYIPVGRHAQASDYIKLNAAAENGWLVFRFTLSMLKQDPVRCVEQVAKTIVKRLLTEENDE